ncbi:hypothetical protein [Terrihabitans sp. B22-R8]|uniref:hypothetical protein n=1 Tax=Terrihabitans sp. B22-R8 TaxID=3425128 RepID=UPI00403C3C3E
MPDKTGPASDANDDARTTDQGTPWLEYVAGTIGAIFALAVLGIIAWDGLTGDNAPPDLVVEIVGTRPAANGFAADIRIRNLGTQTASDVTVEGSAGEDKAEAQFDFVPGSSERKGTLVFPGDMPQADVALRVLGYREP